MPARHVAMTPDQVRGRLWAQRLQRVFKIERLTGEHCGGAVKVIASIEDPAVFKQILEHLDRRAQPATPAFKPFARAPPPRAVPGLKEPGWYRPFFTQGREAGLTPGIGPLAPAGLNS